MDIDFLGSELNLTIVAQEAQKYLLQFSKSDGKTAVPLSNVTLSGVYSDYTGKTQSLDVAAGSKNNEAELKLPALDEGTYGYEVWMSGDDGSRTRLIYGTIGAVSSIANYAALQAGADIRTLLVRMPDKAGDRIEMIWLSTTYAALMAKKAEEKADEAEESAKEADESKQEAERQAAAAEIAKKAAEQVQEKVEEAKQEIEREVVVFENWVSEKETEIQNFVQSEKDWFATESKAQIEKVREIADEKKQEIQNAAENGMQAVEAQKELALQEIREYQNEKIADLEKRVDEIEDEVTIVEGKIAIIHNDIKSAIYPNPATNTWWIAGEDTHYQATGDPGKEPRIADNGNWEIWDEDRKEWVDTKKPSRGEDGFSPYVDDDGYLCWRDSATGEIKRKELRATIAAVRHLVDSENDIPQEGETCNGGHYYYVPRNQQDSDGTWRSWYDVYAWLDKYGVQGWQVIGEANDVASKEQMGLVKLATDVIITSGAPVGFNGEKELTVPTSTYDVAGVGKLGIPSKINSGAYIGLDDNGRYIMRLANATLPGAIVNNSNVSYTEADKTNTIIVTNGVPYVIRGKGEAYGVHKCYESLATLPSDAAYYYNVKSDTSAGLRLTMENAGALQNIDGNLKIVISSSLTQSKSGLSVAAATTSLLAGVYLATAMSDTRENAVATAKTVTEYLNDYYLKKVEALTAAGVREIVNEQLAQGNYVTVETANSIASSVTSSMLRNYSTTDEMNSAISKKAEETINSGITEKLGNYYTKTETATQISDALKSYSNTTAMNTAITNAVNNALKSYSTTTAMNTAITNALKGYATESFVTGKGYLTTTTGDARYVKLGTATIVAYTSRSSMPALSAQQSGVIYMSP